MTTAWQSMDAISTQDLCKRFGEHQVLHDVALRVPSGSLFGFLGPNGAGKTTAIRILLGLLRSSGGRVQILGSETKFDEPRLRARIGYLPGDVRFYDNLTGRATLDFLAGVRRVDCGREIARLRDALDLELEQRVRDYSRGMKQKLGVMQALMHRPELLILDEPTTSLDPLVRETVYKELCAVAGEGRTVLFSSHTLSEVEALCDHVAILRDGRLIEQESIDVLRRRAVRRVECRFDPQQGLPGPLPSGLQTLRRGNGTLTAAWSGAVDPLLTWLAGARLRDVTITKPGLEDLFIAYYDDRDRSAGP